MSQPPPMPPRNPNPGSQWRPPPPPGQHPFAPSTSPDGRAPQSGRGDQLGWGPPPGQPGAPTGAYGPQAQYQQPDPTRAFGSPPPASVSIDSFAEPPSRSNWIIGAVVGVIVVVMLVGAVLVRNNNSPVLTPSPTPTPSTTTSEVPSAVAAGRAVPFESKLDNASGYWEIQKVTWTADGLRLTVLIRLDSGRMDYGFFAMDATDTKVYEPQPTGGSQDLSGGSLKAPDSRTGVLYFPAPRHNMLITLTDSSRRQISTLSVMA